MCFPFFPRILRIHFLYFLHTLRSFHLWWVSSIALIWFPFFLRITLLTPRIVSSSILFYHQILLPPSYWFHLVHSYYMLLCSKHRSFDRSLFYVNSRLVCIAFFRCISRFPSHQASLFLLTIFHTKLLFLANQKMSFNSTATRIMSLFNSQLPISSYIYPKWWK